MRSLNVKPWIFVLTLAALPASGQDLGDPCVPGTPAPRPGLSCQATGDFTFHEPYLLNAQKGDALITASCSRVGSLLRQLPDRQQFDHSGIMVEDRVRLRHSTAAEARYIEGADGDGFDHETLKYGWPGTITQSVYQAFEGQWGYHPDDGTPYRLGIFTTRPATCEGDTSATFPSVVKPPFDQEGMTLPNSTETVREGLRRAGDAALTIEGHYRPYGYTESDLIGRVQGPGRQVDLSSNWAWAEQKLDGSMCSQFVWTAARAAGLPLEDPAVVEPGDKPHARTRSLDGLYEYSEDERRQAATWIYDTLYDEAYDLIGGLGRFLTDLPDDIGNQTVNCFAFDWCGEEEGFEWDGESQPKDSERWRQPGPGTGVTVSPQDLTSWDLPTAGGVYGMTEEMRYRQGSYRPVYGWAASAGTGNLRVQVNFNGIPVPNIAVTLEGFNPQMTDALGQTTFIAIPAGSYFLEAITDRDVDGDGGLDEIHAQATVAIPTASTANVTLSLAPFPVQPTNTTEDHRRINLRGSIFIRDSDWPDADETNTCDINATYVIDPIVERSHRFRFSCCADEVRGQVYITATLDATRRKVS
ncbi:MAG: carboxypeptidase regulatory-like domain-containing protein, partial [Acidobacteria bacterium]|nr:carboxypeptidase regulatory-like domain-containing protein [Acidobacteriota bacterium]